MKFDSNCFFVSSKFLRVISFFTVNCFILNWHSDNNLSNSLYELFNLLYSSTASLILYFLKSVIGIILCPWCLSTELLLKVNLILNFLLISILEVLLPFKLYIFKLLSLLLLFLLLDNLIALKLL